MTTKPAHATRATVSNGWVVVRESDSRNILTTEGLLVLACV